MLIDTIKADQLEARKAKDKFKGTILTTLKCEVENVGLNDGKRVTTDDEAIKVIRKFKTNAEEVLNVETDEMKCREVEAEISIYKSYLPKLMNEAETKTAVEVMLKQMTNPQIGQVMGQLQKEYGNSIDMGLASKVVKSLLK